MFGRLGMDILEAEIIGAEMRMARNLGVGMGMRGIGYCPPGCIAPCCRKVIVCPPGCINSCCINRTRIVCGPGCTLPCCQPMMMNPNPISRYGPIGQNAYLPNRLLPQQPMAPQPMIPQQQVFRQQQPIVPQQIGPQQIMARQMVPQQQMAPQQQMMVQQQVKVMGGSGPGNCPSQALHGPVQSDIERTRRQQDQLQKNRIQNEKQLNDVTVNSEGTNLTSQKTVQMIDCQQGAKGQNLQQNLVNNNSNSSQGIIFQGEVYERIGNRWQCLSASLTSQHFINLPLKAIDKIKIKAESQMKGTRVIKICSGTNEFFYSVPAQHQIQWMLNLFYAKMTVMGYAPAAGQLNGCVEGAIFKKSFFGGWEQMYGALTSQMFKISKTMGGPAQKSITGVSEIWSRFEIIQGTWIVIKMHWLGSKIQVGLPIDNILMWLRGLFNLIR